MQNKRFNLRILLPMLLLAALASVGAGTSSQVALGEFRTRGITADEKASWRLTGGSADSAGGDMVNLTNAELTFTTEAKEKIVVTSPNCQFNRQTKTGSSEAPLHVEHERLSVDGVGYDVLADQQELHIRSKVKMKIRMPPKPDAKPKAETPEAAKPADTP